MMVCSDCQVSVSLDRAYLITPPPFERRAPFWLCPDCWYRLIDLATMSAIR